MSVITLKFLLDIPFFIPFSVPLFGFVESIDGRGMLRVDIGWYLVVSNREGRIVRTCEGAVEGREKRRSVYDYRGKNAIEVVPTRRKST